MKNAHRSGRQEHLEHLERIAMLYRIATAASVSTEDKIASVLEAGIAEFGADRAYVGRFRDGAMEIVHLAGVDTPDARDARLKETLAYADAFVRPDFAGAPLTVEGQPYGALGFAGAGAAMRFCATDGEYLRALAALVASAVQQNEREKRLDNLAFGDTLTGLPNRALLADRLEQTLLFSRRHRRSFAAHYIDIDHFKAINDTYGHQAGDAVLVAVATWLRSVLRDSDTIARIGGDEFVVLQPEIESSLQAEELAVRLGTIRDQRFRIGNRDLAVTISVGCAIFPIDADNRVDMLRAADGKLYDVKHRGRDGYAIGVVA